MNGFFQALAYIRRFSSITSVRVIFLCLRKTWVESQDIQPHRSKALSADLSILPIRLTGLLKFVLAICRGLSISDKTPFIKKVTCLEVINDQMLTQIKFLSKHFSDNLNLDGMKSLMLMANLQFISIILDFSTICVVL